MESATFSQPAAKVLDLLCETNSAFRSAKNETFGPFSEVSFGNIRRELFKKKGPVMPGMDPTGYHVQSGRKQQIFVDDMLRLVGVMGMPKGEFTANHTERITALAHCLTPLNLLKRLFSVQANLFIFGNTIRIIILGEPS